MTSEKSNYAVLFVDDEPNNLVAFRYAMDSEFTVVTASTSEEALRLLQDQRIAVLIADQRMPKMSGAELCARAKAIRPDVVRMIATAYADIQEAIDAINRGHVVRYIAKPWRNEDLAQVVRTAIDFAHMQRTMQDLELRLLRSSQGRAAVAIEDEFVHELSAPLGIARAAIASTLRSVASMLEQEGRLELNAVRTRLAEILTEQRSALHAVEHATAVTHAVRDRERGESREEPVCNAASVIEAIVSILRRPVEQVATLDVKVDGAIWLAMEPSAFGQVVFNLVTNAIQAIEAKNAGKGVIRLELRSEGLEAVLRIEDDGQGIPAPLLSRIFEPYVTTRPEGSGVGLALVRDIVRRSGGRVTAESDDAGTRFDAFIPRATTSMPAANSETH